MRLLRGSKILALVNDFVFTPDPDDANTPCVPHHVVEGVYGRLVEVDADVAATDVQFGHTSLDVDLLVAAEASLDDEFGSTCEI